MYKDFDFKTELPNPTNVLPKGPRTTIRENRELPNPTHELKTSSQPAKSNSKTSRR